MILKGGVLGCHDLSGFYLIDFVLLFKLFYTHRQTTFHCFFLFGLLFDDFFKLHMMLIGGF